LLNEQRVVQCGVCSERAVTYYIAVGQLLQTPEQVDSATPDVAEQTADGGADASCGQH